MKYLTYILLLCMALPAWAQQTVTITSGPAILDVTDEVVTDYDFVARGKHMLWRGPNHSNGPWKIDVGTHWMKFRPVTVKNNPTAKGKGSLKKPVTWDYVDVEHIIRNGLSNLIMTITDPAAQDTFRWTLDTDLTLTQNADGSISLGDVVTLQAPWAVDANGDSVDVSMTFVGPTAGIYTLTKVINTAGYAHPVTADPSVNIAGNALNSYLIQRQSVDYATNRGKTTANFAFADHLFAGANNSDIMRAPQPFVSTTFPNPDSFSYDSATVKLILNAKGSNASWASGVATRSGTGGATAVGFVTGWQSGATPYDVVYLTDSLSTASYSVNDTVTFHLTSAGLDSAAAVAGDALKTFNILFMGQLDIHGLGYGGGSDYFDFDGSAVSGLLPQLTLYYTPFTPGVNTVSALDSHSVIVTIDTLGITADTTIIAVWDGADTNFVDTLLWVEGVTDTIPHPYADSLARVIAYFPDASTPQYGSKIDSVHTLAANTTPTAIGWTNTGIAVKVNQGSNRPETQVALLASSNNFVGKRTLSLAADTSAIADTLFYTVLEWQAVDTAFSGPIFTTVDTVWAVFKNGDSLTTISSAVADSLFGTLTTTSGYVDSTRVSGSSVLSAAPSWVTTLSHWLGASNSTADSALTDTVALTPGTTLLDTTTAGGKVRTISPNTLIALNGNLILNAHDSTLTSADDSLFTDPNTQLLSFTTKKVADSLLVISAVSVGNNPPYTLFGWIDSALVDAGSTKVYYTATGPSATVALFDTAYFNGTVNDTLLIPQGTGVLPNDSTDIYIVTARGDSTSRGL
jgi:hypothetical protein